MSSVHVVKGLTQSIDQAVNLRLARKKGWGQLDGVPTVSNIKALIKHLHSDLIGSLRWFMASVFNAKSTGQSEITNIGDEFASLERMHRFFKVGGQGLDLFNRMFMNQ